MRELSLVHGLEGALAQLATVESGTKLDGRVLTASQVEVTRRGYPVVSGNRGRSLGGGGNG